MLLYYLTTRFGSDWKNKICEYLSWYGLNDTPAFSQFLINENISTAQFENEINFIRISGKNSCN